MAMMTDTGGETDIKDNHHESNEDAEVLSQHITHIPFHFFFFSFFISIIFSQFFFFLLLLQHHV